MELRSITNPIRVGGTASTVAPEGQHAEIDKERFSVITPEEASQRPEAKTFLAVGILDRIKGVFSSNADSTEEAPKGIVALRAQIKAGKEAREAEETARNAPLIKTRISEFHEKLLYAPLGSTIKLDGERISQNGMETHPSLVRRFFRKIGHRFESFMSGAANANPLLSRAQQYDVAKKQQQGVILPTDDSDSLTKDFSWIIDSVLKDFSDMCTGWL